jgi:PBP1b-binding outer membrane lipoprotein LpoB
MRKLVTGTVIALLIVQGCAGTSGPPAEVSDAVRQACPDVSDSDLQNLITSVIKDQGRGATKADELQIVSNVCQSDLCVACVTAVIDQVYDN